MTAWNKCDKDLTWGQGALKTHGVCLKTADTTFNVQINMTWKILIIKWLRIKEYRKRRNLTRKANTKLLIKRKKNTFKIRKPK